MVAVRVAAAAPVALAILAAASLFQHAFPALFALLALPNLELVVIIGAHRVIRFIGVPNGKSLLVLVLYAASWMMHTYSRKYLHTFFPFFLPPPSRFPPPMRALKPFTSSSSTIDGGLPFLPHPWP